MPDATICAVGTALPPHRVDQEELIAAFRRVWSGRHFHLDRLEALHRATQVHSRYLALPLEAYERLEGFEQANRLWSECALALGAQATERALEAAGLQPADVDHVICTTVTGIANPSIDARLMNRLPFRRDLRRLPLFGLGCVAGVAGVARAADLLRGTTDEVAVLLSVELCSLTLQRDDGSIANLVASGLFGDGAAAVVLRAGDRPAEGPRVMGRRAFFYPDTERVMGWDVGASGLRVVLASSVPDLVREHLRTNVDAFLEEHGLQRSDISHWICHPGGPRVLEAFEEALEQPRSAFERTWRSLEGVGNLSSASVLFVLADCLQEGGAKPGEWGLLLAMGPGFCSEMALLRW